MSLRSLDVTGNLKGEFKISKSSAEGLVNGLDNALGQVAADQADKVRVCLQPVRERLLDVMLPPKQGTGQTVTAPGGVAVGGDVKNSPITIGPPAQTPGNDSLIALGRDREAGRGRSGPRGQLADRGEVDLAAMRHALAKTKETGKGWRGLTPSHIAELEAMFAGVEQANKRATRPRAK